MKSFNKTIALIYSLTIACMLAGIYLVDDKSTAGMGISVIALGAGIFVLGCVSIGIMENRSKRPAKVQVQKMVINI